jgi:hypothetical protein
MLPEHPAARPADTHRRRGQASWCARHPGAPRAERCGNRSKLIEATLNCSGATFGEAIRPLILIVARHVPARRSWEYEWTTAGGSGPLPAAEVARLNAIGLTAFASGVAQRALSELIMSAKKTKRLAALGVQADDNLVQFGIGELDESSAATRLGGPLNSALVISDRAKCLSHYDEPVAVSDCFVRNPSN